jgi:hypothetical protein
LFAWEHAVNISTMLRASDIEIRYHIVI